LFHFARPPLPHTDQHDRQQTGTDNTDDWQQGQSRSEVIAALDELQVADDSTESASRYLHHTHQYNERKTT